MNIDINGCRNFRIEYNHWIFVPPAVVQVVENARRRNQQRELLGNSPHGKWKAQGKYW